MDSPRIGRVRPKFSSLPLVFERQILTLGPKVTCVLFLLQSFLYLSCLNCGRNFPSWFDACWPTNDQIF